MMLVFVSIMSNAQVFNTAQVLETGKFALGSQVTFNSGNNLGAQIIGSYGIAPWMDLGVRVNSNNYLGADLEMIIKKDKPYVSAAVGAHMGGNSGIDGTIIGTIPFSNVLITTGLDVDLNFSNNGLAIPIWIPIEIEYYLKEHIGITFEADFGLVGNGWLTGVGLSYYF